MRLALIVCVLAAHGALVAMQVRDSPASGQGGTATIAGVVSDEARRPVRRATVRLLAKVGPARTLVTDTDGAYVFSDLVAGEYAVSASKAAYLTGHYCARRPGGSGTGIVVAAGQAITNATILLARGAVIAGRVLDSRGEPLGSAQVLALRSRRGPGGPSFNPPTDASPASARTDDRGAYRIFGLAPGTYVVVAVQNAIVAEYQVMSRADIETALANVQVQPGRTAPTASTAAVAENRRVVFSPIYFPGTPALSSATTIVLGAGEERLAIDFAMAPVPAARVQGFVTDADGRPSAGANVLLVGDGLDPNGMAAMRQTTAAADGAFAFDVVAPGEYRVFATGAGRRGMNPIAAGMVSGGFGVVWELRRGPVVGTPPAPAETMEAAPPTTAMAAVNVAGDVTSLTLVLRPGVDLMARILVADDPAGGVTLADLRVWLFPTSAAGARVPREIPTAAPGSARFPDVLPGRYRMVVRVPASRDVSAPVWTARSIVVGGRDVIDGDFEVTGDERAVEATVSVTSRGATLGGTLRHPTGQPASEHTLLLFPTDRTQWRWDSRWIKVARPLSDGRYTFAGLAPGEYHLGAVTDVEDQEWFDPAFLQTAVQQSIVIRVGEAEQRVQDLVIPAVGGGFPR